MIDNRLRFGFQISQPGNIPKKKFSTQNEHLDVMFQMRLNPNHGIFSILKKMNRNHGAIFYSVLKRLHYGFCLISP